MPLRACLTCGRPTPGSRCPSCTVDKGYGSAHWQQIRRARLAIDGGRCRLRHDGCTGKATTVHLDPSCGGDHSLATLENTLSACAHCHGVEDAPRSQGYDGGPRKNLSATDVRSHPAGSTFLCTGFRS